MQKVKNLTATMLIVVGIALLTLNLLPNGWEFFHNNSILILSLGAIAAVVAFFAFFSPSVFRRVTPSD